jgi:hypothetical protein
MTLLSSDAYTVGRTLPNGDFDGDSNAGWRFTFLSTESGSAVETPAAATEQN